MLGKPGARGRDYVLQQNNNGNQLGLRIRDESGDWKLIEAPNGQMYNVDITETLRNTKIPKRQLFDLKQQIQQKPLMFLLKMQTS